MKYNYVSIDPGDTIGFGSFRDGIFYSHEFKYPDNTLELLSVIQFLDPTHIIIEDFRIFSSHAKVLIGSRPSPIEVIGIFRLWEMVWGWELVFLQPSCKKNVKVIHDYKFSSEHTKDAYQLMRYYLVRTHERSNKLNRIREIRKGW